MKKILLSAVATSIVASSLLAGGNASGTTTARLDALGLGNTQISDFSNIWANPSNIMGLDDQAYIESKNQSRSGSGGAIYDAGFGKLGLFFARNSINTISKAAVAGTNYTDSFTLDPATVYAATVSAAPTPTNQLDILYGMSLNKNTDLGLRVSYAGSDLNSDSFTDSVTPTNSYTVTTKSSDLELEIGANMKNLNLDFSVSYGLPNAEESVSATAATNSFSSDASVLTAMVGHNLALKNNKTLRSVVYFASSKLGSSATDNTITETKTDNSTVLSATTTLSQVKKDTTTYLSIGIRNVSNTEEFDDGVAAGATVTTVNTGTLTLPIVAAIESKTSEHWTVRGGASVSLWSMQTEDEAQTINNVDQGTYEYSLVPTNVAVINFGTGYSNGNFTIDTVIAAGFTGANILANTSAKLSAIYKF